MSLNGTTTTLVKDDKSGLWRPANDDGTRVEQKFGAANGDNNGEYWVVTTSGGTRYFFGLNRLPGWAPGRPETGSAWTVPVFGNQPGEPCHAATYEASGCDQAWRWNLDYAEDTHHNAMALYWQQERNWYAKNGKIDQPKPYVRGGWLDRIEYGLFKVNGDDNQPGEYVGPNDSIYTGPAPARVRFTVEERCLKQKYDCSDNKFTKFSTDSLAWPDVPVDSYCKETGRCLVGGPTFWTRKWLTTITTEVTTAPGAGTYRRVDEYELKHNFLADKVDTNPPAWLDSIQRTGYAADGASAKTPAVTFHANQTPMPNRQYKDGEARPPFMRLRVAKIFTETGGGIVVTYSAPDPICNPDLTNKPAPEANTSRCFPVFWSPDSADEPQTEWFNKYVVTSVSEEDYVGGAPPKVTSYRYLFTDKDEPGGAAWAKEDSEFVKPEDRTWSQWRGYGRVQVITGITNAAEGTKAGLTETRYFRGMDGDPLPDVDGHPVAPRDVQVKDSVGDVVAEDLLTYQGQVAETVTYTSDEAPRVVSNRKVSVPWSHATATQTRSDGSKVQAFQTATGSTRVVETLAKSPQSTGLEADGPTRTTESITRKFDPYGLPEQVENRGQTAPDVVGDEQCVLTTYVHNTDLNIIGLAAETRTVAGVCPPVEPIAPGAIVSATRTLYDSLPFGSAPTRGDATSVETVNGAGTAYVQTAATAYDLYGRKTALTDAVGNVTATAYTPADNGTPTTIVVTQPLSKFRTVTTFETGRGQPMAVTDPNGRTVRSGYDPLGRLTDVWSASRQAPNAAPNVHHTYAISATAPSVVTTSTLRDNGTFRVAKTLFDGLLRPRQTQTEAIGSGRLVTDTFYNSNGGTRRANAAYLATGEPTDALYVTNSDTEVPTWTTTVYDGLGRATKSELWYGGTQTAERTTVTSYAGQYTTTTPPAGGTPTRTTTDAFGRTTQLEQFTGPASSATSIATTYAYDLRGDRTKVTDAAGNVWTWTYDARGQVVDATDPDKGHTSITYDNANRPIRGTDANGSVLVTTYDGLGRKTLVAVENGPKLASWTYDPEGALGKPAKVSRFRYVNNQEIEYSSTVTGYDTEYHALGNTISIPAIEGPLAGEYTTTQTYTATGKLATTTLPAAGGLPAEKVVTRYNADDLPISTSGAGWYTSDTTYSPSGQILRTQSGTAPLRVWTTNTYNEHTGQLLTSAAHREAGPQYFVAETSYRYDQADNVTYLSTRTATPTGPAAADVQCFRYDTLRRLTDAWTTRSGACTTDPTAGPTGTVGGPDAYWTSYAYDAVGNRTNETNHDPAGNNGGDTTRIYHYAPAATGNTHKLTAVDTAGAAGTHRTDYGYDPAGNTTNRTTDGTAQELLWNTEGRLQNVKNVADETSYLYDANGNRLIGRTTGGTGNTATLYLGNTEITATGSTTTADRYYAHPGAPTAVRSSKPGSKTTFLITDHHGTATAAISTAPDMPFQPRKSTPFGAPRGDATTNWPGTRGFVGGASDISTGLTHLGAREYDPQTGRFISVDPVMDLGDPQQMHGYAYANGNPTSMSDPDGLIVRGHSTRNGDGSRSTTLICDGSCDAFTPRPVVKGNNPTGCGTVLRADVCQKVTSFDVLKSVIQNQADIQYNSNFECKYVDRHGCYRPSDKEWDQGAVESFIAGLVSSGAHTLDMGCQIPAALGAWSSGNCFSTSVDNYYADRGYQNGDAFLNGRVFGDGLTMVLTGPRSAATGPRSALPCSHSFLPDTPVLLANGSTKRIKDIRPGDLVLATDPKTGKTEAKPVEKLITTEDDKTFVEITIAGNQPGKITATENHPLWVGNPSQWLPAGNIHPGQFLRTANGAWAQVTAVQHYNQQQRTNDLTVADIHTYYVLAGKTPVLVHNSSCPTGRLSDDLPPGMNKKIAEAYDAVKLGEIPSHDVYLGREHPWWADAMEYRVPGRPDSDRILVKTVQTQNGPVDVYGWTNTHYTKIQKFSAPQFPDSGW